MPTIEDFRRVDAFATDDGDHITTSPADLVATWQARRVAYSGARRHPGRQLQVSRLQHAFLTAELGVDGTGKDKDPAQAKQLADLWHWWSANVRDRIWVAPIPALIGLLEPPRKAVPPVPDPPTPGDWLTATQQADWWTQVRNRGGGTPARRNAAGWLEIRNLAADVAAAEISAVLRVIDPYEQPAVLAGPGRPHPAVPASPPIGKW